MSLKNYIAETLQELHNQQNIDWNKQADELIAKILDPDYQPSSNKPKKHLTKVESYNSFMEHYQGAVYQTVYNILKESDTPLSRSEIAHRGNLRLATVCARVSELMISGAISVVGTKTDKDTERKVEILSTNF